MEDADDERVVGELIEDLVDAGADEDTLHELIHKWTDRMFGYADDMIREEAQFGGNPKYVQGMTRTRYDLRHAQLMRSEHLSCDCDYEGVSTPEGLRTGQWGCADCGEIVLEEEPAWAGEESNIGGRPHRWVGDRFYDEENDECFTVVDYDGLFAILQYDDGVAWDENIDARANMDKPLVRDGEEVTTSDGETHTIASQLGVDPHGLDSERYVHLGSEAPSLWRSRGICPEEDDHDWYPLPNDLWSGLPGEWRSSVNGDGTADIYPRIARCRRCGISADVAMKYADQDTPTVCASCGDDIDPGAGEEAHFWLDHLFCSTCIAEESIECGSCGDEIHAPDEPASFGWVDGEYTNLCDSCMSSPHQCLARGCEETTTEHNCGRNHGRIESAT